MNSISGGREKLTLRTCRGQLIEAELGGTVYQFGPSCQLSKIDEPSVVKKFPDCKLYSVVDPSLSEGVYYLIMSNPDQKIYITVISESGRVNLVDLHVLRSRLQTVEEYNRDCLTLPLSDESIDQLKFVIKSNCDDLYRDYKFLKTPSQSDVYQVAYTPKQKRPFFPTPSVADSSDEEESIPLEPEDE